MVRKRLKEYTKSFIRDESGMELLQMVVVVVVTVGLISVVWGLKNVIANNITDASEQANTSLQNILNGGGGGGGD